MKNNLNLLAIKDDAIKLTNIEKSLLNFINTESEFFVNNNIFAVAQHASMSAAITRFARTVGFTSFKNLQLHVYEKYHFYKTNYFLSEGDDWENTIKNIKSANIYSIHETIDNIDTEILSNFIEQLASANRIFIHGIGSNYLACQQLANNLTTMGKNAIINQDFQIQLLNLSNLNSTDKVVLFSNSLNTKEIHYLINKADSYKIPITLITASQYGVLDRKITNKINYTVHEESEKFSSISAKICQLLIVDIVSIQVKNLLKKNNHFFESEGPNPITEWNRM